MNGKLRNMTSVYLTKQNQILLLYRVGSRVIGPSWCGIGGHFEKEELNDAKACVLRELQEELHVSLDQLENIELRYITMRLKNNEIRQNYYFFAECKEDTSITLECNEGTPKWFPIDEILDLPMPVSAKPVITHYLKTGRNTDALYAGCSTEKGIDFCELKEF